MRALSAPALRWAAAALACALVSVAALHAPPLQRWLAARGHTGGAACPFGYSAASARTSPHARPAASPQVRATVAGATPAHARPALGFAFAHTTIEDLTRWAAAHGIGCVPQRGGTRLTCTHVPGAAVPNGDALGFSDLAFDLDAGTLVAIRGLRRAPSPEPVATAFTHIETYLTAHAGAPTTRAGSPAPDALASAALRQASIEYRFADYRAVIRATHLGDRFVLTEDYAALGE